MVVKQKRSKTWLIVAIVIISIIVAVVLWFFIDSRRQYQKRVDVDAQYYQEALGICETEPFMIVEQQDNIEGVRLDHYYYAPGTQAYDDARTKALKGDLSYSYEITYVCSPSDASATGAEQAP